MKKVLILVIIPIIIFMLAGCDLIAISDKITETIIGCEHDYDEGIIIKEATCSMDGIIEYKCNKCQFVKTDSIPKKEHNYENPISDDATCTIPGMVIYTCSICGNKKEVEGDLIPHTLREIRYDEDEDGNHYKICSVCLNGYDYEKHEFSVSEVVHWDCTHDGVANLSCCCGYSFNKNIKAEHNYLELSKKEQTCVEDGFIKEKCSGCGDEKSIIIPKSNIHNYEGHICLMCQMDEMMQYELDFTNKGTSSNPINIDSEKELVCLIDYVTYYGINQANKKVFTLKYLNQGIDEELKKAIGKATGANIGISYEIVNYGNDSFGNIYSTKAIINPTKKAGIDYEDKSFSQVKLDSIYIKPSSRTNLTTLPYETRKYEISVSSSNQLFYALSHGYKPVVKDGSSAYRIFNKALAVSRNICDEEMSDVEKIIAIYDWIVNNVSYDTGAVDAVDNHIIDWEECDAWYLEGVFDDGLAVCDGISKAFSLLCGIENIICVQPSGTSHAWNKVYVDGNNDGKKEWYIIDPTFANSVSNEDCTETYNIKYLFFTDSERINQGYYAKSHNECVANTFINPYKLIHYSSLNTESDDLYIESELELKALLLNVKSNMNYLSNNLSIAFMIDKNYTGNTWNRVIGNVFGNVSIRYIEYKNLYEIGNNGYMVSINL